MSQNWYIKGNKKVHGPFSVSQIKKLAESGRLTPDHLVSKDQIKWSKAVKLAGLSFQEIDPSDSDEDLTTSEKRHSDVVPEAALQGTVDSILGSVANFIGGIFYTTILFMCLSMWDYRLEPHISIIIILCFVSYGLYRTFTAAMCIDKDQPLTFMFLYAAVVGSLYCGILIVYFDILNVIFESVGPRRKMGVHFPLIGIIAGGSIGIFYASIRTVLSFFVAQLKEWAARVRQTTPEDEAGRFAFIVGSVPYFASCVVLTTLLFMFASATDGRLNKVNVLQVSFALLIIIGFFITYRANIYYTLRRLKYRSWLIKVLHSTVVSSIFMGIGEVSYVLLNIIFQSAPSDWPADYSVIEILYTSLAKGLFGGAVLGILFVVGRTGYVVYKAMVSSICKALGLSKVSYTDHLNLISAERLNQIASIM